ncbi:MAG: adenylylsulfate reductase [Firmicutes bacterium]|nr:adenylylsulfate reductase [Bacillota bacterium]
MTIKINCDLCNGCPGRKEGRCERICPGNLLERKNNKAVIEHKSDCWDCAACVKACPLNAIQIYLPDEIGGKGGNLSAQVKEDEIIWIIEDNSGESRKYHLAR